MSDAAGSARMPIDERLVGFVLPALEWRWEPRDVALYALGVGAGAARDLPLLYERHGPLVLPSFATVAVGMLVAPTAAAIEIDLHRLLHLEQSVAVAQPLPARGHLLVERTVLELRRTERAAILAVADVARDGDGIERFRATSSWWVAGAGSGRPGAGSGRAAAHDELPEREPDAREVWRTSAEQAALYRLSGDLNPIHLDAGFAIEAGYARPMLHGLCTFGAATLAAVRTRCEGDPRALRSISGRFTARVEPGDELETELWWTGALAARLRTRVGDHVVLDAGQLTLAE